uniref:Secreted protein n=1 Tax=Ascaris lumbricoides TaxID=6252 RepID=A0A0M3I493_ASCLU
MLTKYARVLFMLVVALKFTSAMITPSYTSIDYLNRRLQQANAYHGPIIDDQREMLTKYARVLFMLVVALKFTSAMITPSYTSIDYLNRRLQQANAYHEPIIDDQSAPIMKRSRLCILNAGLSQGCDLSDMLFAKLQANKFSSFAGPGRR